jgi:hypothetical protein
MLEAAYADLAFIISLKRSTLIFRQADYPIFRRKSGRAADISKQLDRPAAQNAFKG